jgi:hypothetical protein
MLYNLNKDINYMGYLSMLLMLLFNMIVPSIFIGGGIFMIDEGIQRGSLYKHVNENDIRYLKIMQLSKSNTLFADLYAIGYVDSMTEITSVKIFSNDHKIFQDSIKNGIETKIRVLPTNLNSNEKYVYIKKYEESKPIFRLNRLFLSWHFIPGLLSLCIGIVIIVKSLVDFIKPILNSLQY